MDICLQEVAGKELVVALLIQSSYFAVTTCPQFNALSNQFSASCELRTYFQNDLVQFPLKSLITEEIIRLRRVLLKTLCLYLSKITVLIKPLINFPAMLHSEDLGLHLRFSLRVWHSPGNILRWEPLRLLSLETCNSLWDTGSSLVRPYIQMCFCFFL